MAVEFLDPRPEPPREQHAYRLVWSPESDAAVGLLANSFPDADTLLRELANRMPAPADGFREYRKPGLDPAPPGLLDLLVGECGAALAAFGH